MTDITEIEGGLTVRDARIALLVARFTRHWIPAFAGMTGRLESGLFECHSDQNLSRQ